MGEGYLVLVCYSCQRPRAFTPLSLAMEAVWVDCLRELSLQKAFEFYVSSMLEYNADNDNITYDNYVATQEKIYDLYELAEKAG